MKRKVWTFFYGSFANPQVLSNADVFPTDAQQGRLDGWDIVIEPRATLRPSDECCVYGILAKASHADLDKLYSKDWFGFGAYLPEAVNIAIGNARYVPAMCYISWEMEQGFLIGRIDFSGDFLYCCFFSWILLYEPWN